MMPDNYSQWEQHEAEQERLERLHKKAEACEEQAERKGDEERDGKH